MAATKNPPEVIQTSIQASNLETKTRKNKVAKPSKKKTKRKIKSPEFVEDSDIETPSKGKENVGPSKKVQHKVLIKTGLAKKSMTYGDGKENKYKAGTGISEASTVNLPTQHNTDIRLKTELVNHQIADSTNQKEENTVDRLDHAAILLLNAATTLWMMRNQPASIFDDHSWRAGHWVSVREAPLDEKSERLALRTFAPMELNMLRESLAYKKS